MIIFLIIIEVRRLRILAFETLKTLNQFNLSPIKEFFNMRKGTHKREEDTTIPARKAVIYGNKK